MRHIGAPRRCRNMRRGRSACLENAIRAEHGIHAAANTRQRKRNRQCNQGLRCRCTALSPRVTIPRDQIDPICLQQAFSQVRHRFWRQTAKMLTFIRIKCLGMRNNIGKTGQCFIGASKGSGRSLGDFGQKKQSKLKIPSGRNQTNVVRKTSGGVLVHINKYNACSLPAGLRQTSRECQARAGRIHAPHKNHVARDEIIWKRDASHAKRFPKRKRTSSGADGAVKRCGSQRAEKRIAAIALEHAHRTRIRPGHNALAAVFLDIATPTRTNRINRIIPAAGLKTAVFANQRSSETLRSE